MRIKITNLPVIKKISCIRVVRYAFNMSLQDAKTLVEKGISNALNNTFELEGDTVIDLDTIRCYIHSNKVFSHNECPSRGCNMPQVIVKEFLKISDIKTEGMQVFNVPNDQEGRDFIKLVAKYLNRPQYKLSRHSRGSRKKHRSGDLSLAHAEWIAVYVKGGNIDSLRESQYEVRTSIRQLLRMKLKSRTLSIGECQEENI